MERWRPVPGYEWGYEVSNLGGVRSIDREREFTKADGSQFTRRYKGKPLSACADDGGYYNVSLGAGSSKRVHILVAAAWHGPCPSGYEVNHKDGSKANNTAENLEYATPSQNIRHAISIGTFGVKSGPERPAITAEQVQAIRAMPAAMTSSEVARQMNLPRYTVSRARNGKTWKIVA